MILRTSPENPPAIQGWYVGKNVARGCSVRDVNRNVFVIFLSIITNVRQGTMAFMDVLLRHSMHGAIDRRGGGLHALVCH